MNDSSIRKRSIQSDRQEVQAGKAWQGETVLRMLDRKDARQGELFGAAA